MGQRIFVTGAGIVTAIGRNLPQTLESLKAGKSGIGPIRHLQTIHRGQIPVAEVPFSNDELFDLLGIVKQEGYTRTTLLGMLSLSEALADSENRRGLTTGLISANTVGGMDKSEQFYYKYLREGIADIYIETHDCGDSTERLARHFGLTGFLTTVSTACSSAANSILLGARLIRNGTLQRAVCGGIECLTKFHINGFNSLKILSPEACRPFDANRNGISLGEGAAYLVLEGEETAFAHRSTVVCELSGWGNTCEAFHQTASSPDGDGAYLAMSKALTMCGLKPSQIGYINAHGTGTDNNDLSEGRAIERLFAPDIPAVSSTKPFTGHTTSAAGAVESIISILGMNNGLLFPNLNFAERIPELSFSPVTSLTPVKNLQHVLTNSFGFGGNNTALIFSKFQG